MNAQNSNPGQNPHGDGRRRSRPFSAVPHRAGAPRRTPGNARTPHRTPFSAPSGGAPRPAAPHRRPGGQSFRGPARGGSRGGARQNRFRQPVHPPREALKETPEAERIKLPPLDADTVRIMPVGGVEEVGRNMTLVELPEGILIFDAGFQFVPEEMAPGIDYVLPNTKYLEENKERILGLFITHGHLDHIGGIPYIIDRIGNPPIYTQYLTSLMIKKRQEEFPHLPPVDLRVLEPGGSVQVSLPNANESVTVKSFPVTHSIPDSMGLAIVTKHGNIVISGDLRLEHEDGVPTEKEEKNWSKLGEDKNILFIADSTNAEKDGFSIPEKRVYDTLEDILRTVKGRLIIGTFSSQFERMIFIIKLCEKLGKKIVTEGRAIKTNIEIAERGNIFTPKPGTIIPAEHVADYPPDKIVVIATGSQGEESAALMRIATGKHKTIAFTERDTVVLSSSVIPGNETHVQILKDNLLRRGVTLIHYRSSDVHSTGHGNTGELVWMREHVKPQFFMPGYGYYSMLKYHANAQIAAGFPKDHVIMPDNGSVIEIKNGTELHIRKEKIPANPLMVDGFAIGDMQEVVLRDRKSLAEDGMFVIIATVNLRTGQLKKSPDIISRGFVYLRESQNLLSESRLLIKKTVEDLTAGMNPIDLEYVKTNLTDTVERYLLQKTSKRPMVIPVLIGV
ncbi:MAG: RNase J family beta-CASP ribonuclease [Patescibacteria group bacterium]|nr:RNase J family beta-CASP ribonuclease [Patescibacteria group bacterium]